MRIEVFKHLGTVAWHKEMLKMSVSMSASLIAQTLSTCPGMLSGLAALCRLILARILLESAELMTNSGWPGGGEGPLLPNIGLSSVSNWAKKLLSQSVTVPSLSSIHIPGIMLCQHLESLPHTPGISCVPWGSPVFSSHNCALLLWCLWRAQI